MPAQRINLSPLSRRRRRPHGPPRTPRHSPLAPRAACGWRGPGPRLTGTRPSTVGRPLALLCTTVLRLPPFAVAGGRIRRLWSRRNLCCPVVVVLGNRQDRKAQADRSLVDLPYAGHMALGAQPDTADRKTGTSSVASLLPHTTACQVVVDAYLRLPTGQRRVDRHLERTSAGARNRQRGGAKEWPVSTRAGAPSRKRNPIVL